MGTKCLPNATIALCWVLAAAGCSDASTNEPIDMPTMDGGVPDGMVPPAPDGGTPPPPPEGPTIEIVSPTSGSFVPGGTVTVLGRIAGDPATHSVSINGQDVTFMQFDPGAFSAVVTIGDAGSVNPIVAHVTDTDTGLTALKRVTVISGQSTRSRQLSPNASSLHVTDNGLNTLEAFAKDDVRVRVKNLVRESISPGEILFEDSCVRALGVCHNVVMRVTLSPTIQGADLDLQAHGSQLNVQLDLRNMFLAGNASISLSPNCGISIGVGNTRISAVLDVSPDPSEPKKLRVRQLGPPEVEITRATGRASCGTLPGSGTVEDKAEAKLDGEITPRLEARVLAAMATGSDGHTPLSRAFEDELDKIVVDELTDALSNAIGGAFDAEFSAVVEGGGGVTVGVDAGAITDCAPVAGAPALTQSYDPRSPLPDFPSTIFVSPTVTTGGGTTTTGGTTTATGGGGTGASPLTSNTTLVEKGVILPPVTRVYGAAVAVSPGALNQILRMETECGLLVDSIDEVDLGSGATELNAGLLGAFVTGFTPADPTARLRIDIRPTIAPFVTEHGGPNNALAAFQVPHVVATVRDDATDDVLLEGVVDATLGVDLRLDTENNTLGFLVREPSESDVAFIVTRNETGGDVTALEELVPSMLAPTIPDLAGSLEAFPLPSLERDGVEIAVPLRVSRLEGHFVLYADLPTPPPKFCRDNPTQCTNGQPDICKVVPDLCNDEGEFDICEVDPALCSGDPCKIDPELCGGGPPPL